MKNKSPCTLARAFCLVSVQNVQQFQKAVRLFRFVWSMIVFNSHLAEQQQVSFPMEQGL